MKKTFNINLAGMIFHIDDDAFARLESYLRTLRQQFQQTSGGDEIMNDVETRMAELFRERTSESKQVINSKDVDEVIAIMGKPEDYLGEEQANAYTYQETYSGSKKIHRDVDNRMIGGVASGLAAYFNIDSLWMRLLFLVALFAGFGFLLYVILWIVVPAARTTTEKLQMRGKPVTLSNIENFVKEESAAVGESMSKFGNKARNYSGGGQNVIAAFFTGIFDILKLIIKFIFKAIGFFFLAIGIIVLISLAASLFIGFEIDGYHYNFHQFGEMIQIFSSNSGIYNGLMVGSSLLVLGPLLLILYWGVRIIFGIEPLNAGMRRGLGLLTLAGLITLIVSGIQIAREFENESIQSKEYAVEAKEGMIYLEIDKDSVYQEVGYRYRDNNYWHLINGRSFFSNIEFDVQSSRTGESYIIQKFYGRGRNYEIARSNALETNYNLKVDTGLVQASSYFTLPRGAYFRGQKIDITLFLAEGDTLYLADGMESIIHDIDNVQNIYDPEMVDHYWTMTPRGLYCTDCSESEEDLFWEEEFPEGDDETEIIIEDDLIRIKEVEVSRTEERSEKIAFLQNKSYPNYLI